MSESDIHPLLDAERDETGKVWVRGDFDFPVPGEPGGGEFRAFDDSGYVVLVHDTPVINEGWMLTPLHAARLARQLIEHALRASSRAKV